METPEEEQPKTSREHIAALYGRLEKLEQALSEHMAATRDDMVFKKVKAPFRPEPMDGFVSAEHYNYEIDTKASPKGIPFEVALMYVKAGRCIMRAGRGSWTSRDYDTRAALFGNAMHDDLMATDWEVIPREE